VAARLLVRDCQSGSLEEETVMSIREQQDHQTRTEETLFAYAGAYPSTVSRQLNRFTKILGGFYLTMAGINIGLSVGDPQMYKGFAHAAHFDWVGQAWQTIFMAQPAVWAALLGLGEVLVGIALLTGGRWSLLGYGGVIAFHLALLLFGWGVWLWAVPVLVVVVPAARAYLLALRRAVP
jgi:hypothetical protein